MEKPKFESPDMTAQNIDRIAALFPNCITEASDGHGGLKRAINFEMLKQMLSPDVVDGDEAYEFTWVGKKAAIVEANKPIRKTLRPCVAESKDWDTTENLYIEGDNLEVLKLLQESYLGKVKMIYIDPPYNTGNDFIYADDFMRSQEEENEQMGMYDEDENRLFKNTDTNGRFHSDWCSMIYSRLMLARNLLTGDGAIYISIADQEVENLKKIANEVFGERNFIGQIIWESTTQPDNIGGARYRFQQKAEYILFYAKNKATLAPFILERLEPQKKYPHDGKFGKCRFEIIERSFEGAYARPTMRFQILGQYPREGKQWQIGEEQARKLEASGKVEIVDGVVKRAVYPEDEQDDDSFKPFWSIFTAKDAGTSQKGKALLKDLLGRNDFDTVKPVTLLKKLLGYFVRNGIILDFFSGSATTAHAVMKLNAEDGGHRKFIMVQLPEKCDEASDAYKAGYKNICEIGKERIRRAGDKIKEALLEDGIEIRKIAKHKKEHGDLEGFSYAEWEESPEVIHAKKKMADSLDIGFRVLKLDDTNMKDVYYAPDDYDQGMLAGLESNIKDDRTDLDLLFGCLIDWGQPLSLPYKSEQIDGCTVHTYNDGDLIACFDANIPESVVKEIAKRKPHRAIFRDSGFASSPEKINVFEIFKLYMPEDANDITKRVRVI